MAARKEAYLQGVRLRDGAPGVGDGYPFGVPAVRQLEAIRFHPRVTFFAGENGAGKSTVLEALALALGYGPEGGTRNVRFATVESVSELHRHLRVSRGIPRVTDGYFLRAESFFNVASYMEEVGYLGGYGGRSPHERSHGEAVMDLLTTKFRGDGLYLLDEPEAGLSAARQLAALCAVHDLVGRGSQFVIVTQSPILLSYPDAAIYEFGVWGVREVGYEETEAYRVTRDFLGNVGRRLEQLLGAAVPPFEI